MPLTMSDGTQLKTWVNGETKARFAAVARHQGLSDSALLKRLVDTMPARGQPGKWRIGRSPGCTGVAILHSHSP
jgi:hypothetical protein